MYFSTSSLAVAGGRRDMARTSRSASSFWGAVGKDYRNDYRIVRNSAKGINSIYLFFLVFSWYSCTASIAATACVDPRIRVSSCKGATARAQQVALIRKHGSAQTVEQHLWVPKRRPLCCEWGVTH